MEDLEDFQFNYVKNRILCLSKKIKFAVNYLFVGDWCKQKLGFF